MELIEKLSNCKSFVRENYIFFVVKTTPNNKKNLNISKIRYNVQVRCAASPPLVASAHFYAYSAKATLYCALLTEV